MTTLFILNHAPYGTEHCYNALRLAGALPLKRDEGTLISLIATAPQVAASKATNQSATTAVQSVGQDLSGATQSAIGAYVTLPNVITVDPGTAVSVIVDRDLGIY